MRCAPAPKRPGSMRPTTERPGRELRRRAAESAEDRLPLRRLPHPRLLLERPAACPISASTRCRPGPIRPSSTLSQLPSEHARPQARSSHLRGACCRRQGRPQQGAALEPRRLAARGRPGGPGRAARGPGDLAGRPARAAALRAHAGLALHLLPRRGGGDGGGPRRDPAQRLRRAALRRCPPLQLRRLRLARPRARLRRQRLRRDPAGTVGVGRDAARRELLRRRARARLQAARAAGDRRRDVGRVPGGDAADGRARQPRGLVHEDRRGSDRQGLGIGRRREGSRHLPPQPREDPGQGPDARPLEADPRSRRRAAHRQRTAADRADRRAGRRGRRHRGRRAEDHLRLPRHAPRGPPRPARRLPLRRRGAEGGRRRQRRHPRLRRADAGPRQRRPTLPPGQGSAALRARALRRAERLREPGRARRPGPAPDPGGQRHPARLGQSDGHRRQAARLLRAPALGPEGLGQGREHETPAPSPPTPRSAARPWPTPTPAAATASRSPPIWARATPSTRRSPASRRPTPTRTSATTRR